MKILFIAPLTRKITPQVTASRPRAVFDLVSRMLKRGHQVAVLGTADSRIPGAKIIPVIKKGFYEIEKDFENPFYTHTSFLIKQAKIAERIARKFDIIHSHAYPEFINLFLTETIKTPVLTTLHLVMNREIDSTLSLFKKAKIVCPTSSKKLAQKTKVYKTINLGVDTNLYGFEPVKNNYLLWVGRLSRSKNNQGNFIDPQNVKLAIKLAEETGSELKLVANVEDVEFFNKEIKPHLSNKIKWIGGVSFNQPLAKKEIVKLMQKAKALLMFSDTLEGLVVKEAMSCGTPIIGFPKQTFSSLVADGKTGFVVIRRKGIEGLKQAVKNLDKISPKDCRTHVEKNFNLEKTVIEYEKVYKQSCRSY